MSAPGRGDGETTVLSVVLPVFNEARVLRELTAELVAQAESAGCVPELLYVNDGSSDGSAELLDELAAEDRRVRVLHLSRNFGHQAAVHAGLCHASGAAVIVMDTDLQDRPDAIPAFVKTWRDGHDVVYAVRVGRKEGPVKRALFFAFYRFLDAISGTPMPLDAGNFGLLDARVARQVAELAERDRYYAGLRRWVGFSQVGIPIERGGRYDDTPRVSMLGLVRLAKAAIFSFSTFPLTVFYGIAALALATLVGLGAFTLYHRLFTGLAIPGWTSIVLTGCFFGGLNALGIGILGEFVVRIYDQVRGRPGFIVARRVNFEEPG